MGQPGTERIGTIAALCGLAMLGGVTSLAGVAGLRQLQQSHLTEELFVTATPRTFQAWFADRLRRRTPAPGHGGADLVARAAGRLLLMGLDQRFALTQAMMRDRFWSELSFTEDGRQRALDVAEAAVLRALSLSPGAGDLWLMAAKIRTVRHGFDASAAAYLHASQLLSSGEGAVVRARFAFSVALLPLLQEQAKQDFERDRDIVERIDPRLFELARRWTNREILEDELPSIATRPVGPVGTVRPVPVLRGASR